MGAVMGQNVKRDPGQGEDIDIVGQKGAGGDRREQEGYK